MKTLIIIALTIVGMVPASTFAQTLTPSRLSSEGIVGRASSLDLVFPSIPKSRARTLDLRASINLGNIDHNFWGIYSGLPIDPSRQASPCSNCQWTSACSTCVPTFAEAYIGALYYTVTSGGIVSHQSPQNVECGTAWGGLGTNKSTHSSLSVQNDTTTVCNQLWFSGDNYSENHQFQQAFDTLRYFIETCPHNAFAPSTFLSISSAMVEIHGPGGGSYRATYEAWLGSVLYLDTTNPEYYCACAEQVAGYLPLPHDTLPGYFSRWTNIPLSVIDWLIHNTTCDTPALSQEYDQSRQSQLEQWANDPTAYKLDTTLLPLDSIQPGLQELLEKHFLYADVSERRGPDIITNATASPNPLNTGTIISFGISKEAYVRIEVFDLLGNRVSSSGFESLFEPGNKAVPISLQGLAAGTYFARIVTAYGEVQTVKLVKE